jgi:hypothetical protein
MNSETRLMGAEVEAGKVECEDFMDERERCIEHGLAFAQT